MYSNVDALAEQVGIRVREARVQAGLSVQDVSLSLGITAHDLIAAEQGNLRLFGAQIIDLCDLFSKSPSWFFSS
ncbi:MAG: XRE family transcriptional regulator [Cytophagaceae bacterium]|nr:MAG: XRE family transcriptional regulator [Cytophagaceae bacterium]